MMKADSPIGGARADSTEHARDARRSGALRDQVSDRFRQSCHQNGNQHQGHYPAEIENRLPAKRGNHPSANQPADYRAELVKLAGIRLAPLDCVRFASSCPSLDYCTCWRRHGGRHVKNYGLGGLHVDHKLEPRGLLYRKICWFLALEDLVNERSCAAPDLWKINSVGGETPGLAIFSEAYAR